ncbi:LysR family transcriptional regulator [Bariatricus sp. SGI.154]|uniref:LysR family transcriptional regulator n=1 Tax=Bariatricus sp. SGI.154 TaxID=3420549 RepID=UPI003D008D0A
MDIKKWRVMLAVDDYGSFTRAGEEFGYTQSGITQMMRALEKDVGFPLFIKDNHGVTLTGEAKSLIPSIRALLNSAEVVTQEIAFLKGAQKGTIKIGTYLSCSIHWIPKIIREFQQKYPDIIFKVIEGSEGDLADWIEERRVDIGFISYQKGQNYQFLPVMDDELFAILPKDHPFTAYDEIPVELFQGTPFVITKYTPGSDVHRILREYKIKPDIRYITINEFSIISMVEQGLGLSILPGLLLRGQIGDFETRPLVPRAYRQLGLAFSSPEELSPASKKFLKYAKDFLLDD